MFSDRKIHSEFDLCHRPEVIGRIEVLRAAHAQSDRPGGLRHGASPAWNLPHPTSIAKNLETQGEDEEAPQRRRVRREMRRATSGS